MAAYPIFLVSIFSFALLSLHSQAAPINCTSLWQRGFPGARVPMQAVPCSQVTSPHLAPDHQLFIDDSLQADPRMPGFSLSIAKAIGSARQIFLRGGMAPGMKAVIYSQPYTGDGTTRITYANAFIDHVASGRPEACPVVIYPSALTFDQEQMKQLIAHELFHCFQKKHAPAQALLGARSGIGLWFLEGTAQAMSDLVYPLADLEWTSIFPLYDPSQTLVNQNGYANAVFFMSWLKSSSYMSGKIIDFVAAMPSRAGVSFEAAFAAIPNSAQYFHEFAQRFNAGNLTDAAGHLTPYAQRPPQSIRTVSDQKIQELDIAVQPLMTQYEQFVLPKKGRYSFSIVSGDSPHIKISTKNADEETWAPLSNEVRTPCDIESTQDFLVTSVNPDRLISTLKIRITREEEMDCGCDTTIAPTDRCLSGSWLLDSDSTRDFFENRFQGSANELVSISGDYRLNFTSASDFNLILNKWKVTTLTKVAGSENKIKMETTADGNASSKYSDGESNRVCANYSPGKISFKNTIYLNTGPVVSPIDPILGSPNRKIEFTYQCSGDVLIYKDGLGVGPGGSNVTYNFKFLRQ